jgi:cephalosporin-C deacetylase-like acetyl esterase
LKIFEESIIPALKNYYKTMQLGYEQNTEELFMLYDAWEKLNMKHLEYIELLNQALRIQVTIERIVEKN